MQPFLRMYLVSATHDDIHQIYLQSSLLWSQFDLESGDVRRFSCTEVGDIQLEQKLAGNIRVNFHTYNSNDILSGI